MLCGDQISLKPKFGMLNSKKNKDRFCLGAAICRRPLSVPLLLGVPPLTFPTMNLGCLKP